MVGFNCVTIPVRLSGLYVVVIGWLRFNRSRNGLVARLIEIARALASDLGFDIGYSV
jgi:hypothetical protein